MYQEIEGDLIELAKEGYFHVIVQGCNCFCRMESGLAKQMVITFKCNTFKLEEDHRRGKINKLGQIDFEYLHYSNWDKKFQKYPDDGDTILHALYVVNAYTQFKYGRNHPDGEKAPIDYEALTLCLRKINYQFNGLKIGLPRIGADLYGGNWEKIRRIIQRELKDCDVTVVSLTQEY
jgi:O-acetyl-ADP-ribose deacetylase (regulator of RNase III)